MCSIQGNTPHLTQYTPEDCYVNGSCRNNSACTLNSDCKYNTCTANKCVETACQIAGTCAKIVKFTTSGTTTWTVPAGVTSLRVLVVGGGGGGGGCDSKNQGGSVSRGVGGSGGAVIENNSYTVTPGQTISITIGAGGNGGPHAASGFRGGDSIFGTITASGGVGGGLSQSFLHGAGASGNGPDGKISTIEGSDMYYGGAGGPGSAQPWRYGGGLGGGGAGGGTQIPGGDMPPANGDNGSWYGGGGGGGAGGWGGAGGAGYKGIVIISSPNLP